MTTQSATIKVWCLSEQLEATATMLSWAVGHRVEIAEAEGSEKVGHLLIFTDIEYYENDATILDRLGLNIIGKIRGVVSWEVLPRTRETAPDVSEVVPPTPTTGNLLSEEALIAFLRTLPVPIAIMRRDNGEYVWKCIDASGVESTFSAAVETALEHLSWSYKLIRSEHIG
ncbi:hypothetical protein [Tengunoibacter tsumagoiensis]|uniref:Uncharacterized protein n=1 Tax=Tengunoibacter tsumagoiensis TaxID=2014871 RepID=A0A402A9U2_9CHLR|nr:hypothetical protein [Tengunoibacter tsumagoiensis]GCE15786.1 hypothetical protein KTT_56450 [Tengunoibacter tsumagoiensis]